MKKDKPRIALLGLMQELYDDFIPGITKHQEDYIREVIKKLEPAVDIYFPGAARNRKDVENYMKEFNNDDMAGVMVVNLVYGPGVNLVRALQNNRLPLLLANIQPEYNVSPDWDMNDLTYNQGIHGMQDTANTVIRTVGNNFSVITDDWRSEAFAAYVENWAMAAHTANELKKMRIAFFGKMNGMHDTITDFAAMMRVIGPEIREERMGDVYRMMESLTDQEIRKQIEKDKKVFAIDTDLPEESHIHAVKIMLAFEKILEREGYAGYTANFDVFKGDGRFRQLGLLAASNLMAKGYGYGAEGDVNSTTLVSAFHILGGAANFTEMYAMDFSRNSMLMSHMGEGNWKFARKDKPIRLANRELGIGALENPPTPVFMVEPGEATIASLIPLKGDHFRVVTMKGNVLDTEEHPRIEMPYFHFSPESGVRAANTKWLKAGGSHHQAMVAGDMRKRIELLCDILGIEYVEV